MGSAPAPRKEESMTMEVQLTKRLGASTKRLGRTTKGLTMIQDHSESGGDGDYAVTIANGTEVLIDGATAIRVLDHGELNLVTDAGRWYLFAPGAWQTAFPTQPKPGKSSGNA
jgi:hypothetical protein